MSCPELKLTEVTKDEKIFCCSSVLGQARYVADSITADEDLFVAPADAKPRCCAFVFYCSFSNFAISLNSERWAIISKFTISCSFLLVSL